jgi:hypothetical protein
VKGYESLTNKGIIYYPRFLPNDTPYPDIKTDQGKE